MSLKTVGVIGSGAWGTALAHIISTAGNDVTLWGRNSIVINDINIKQENTVYLKGLKLNPNIKATSKIENVCKTDVLVLAVPAQQIRMVTSKIQKLIKSDVPIICSAKGFELKTGMLMSEVFSETLNNKIIAVLSGPTFANEIINEMPTAATLAIKDQETGEKLAKLFSSSIFRPYISSDIIGVQVGGAVKNIIAIACGIALGQGFGENTRAAIVTRGLAETTRLAVALGGTSSTLSGLSGLGDFLLTCTSQQSRNFTFGKQLGEGYSPEFILKNMKGVVEGWYSSAAVTKRAKILKVDLPICSSINSILNENADINSTIQSLLQRPIRQELQ
jgi:glycerol-3-phosphate dehydrogenase (NAD(P)+)